MFHSHSCAQIKNVPVGKLWLICNSVCKHFWGEDPAGEWMLNFKYQINETTANITNVSVTWYGTSEVPVSVQNISAECDPLGCARTGAEYCDAYFEIQTHWNALLSVQRDT